MGNATYSSSLYSLYMGIRGLFPKKAFCSEPESVAAERSLFVWDQKLRYIAKVDPVWATLDSRAYQAIPPMVKALIPQRGTSGAGTGRRACHACYACHACRTSRAGGCAGSGLAETAKRGARGPVFTGSQKRVPIGTAGGWHLKGIPFVFVLVEHPMCDRRKDPGH